MPARSQFQGPGPRLLFATPTLLREPSAKILSRQDGERREEGLVFEHSLAGEDDRHLVVHEEKPGGTNARPRETEDPKLTGTLTRRLPSKNESSMPGKKWSPSMVTSVPALPARGLIELSPGGSKSTFIA